MKLLATIESPVRYALNRKEKGIYAHAILLLMLLAAVPSISQTNNNNNYPRVSIASPNAASLGKFTDHPVNLHTGIPDVTIPIYTVKEGTLELPVSL
ncbi:MAG TPA: hypothetical protein VEB86_09950, partial [Chryseosolibacter sp.]|nr:hypothetical protein [Chryseosolibacter sp.]